jgi:hypothetical protein
MRLVARRRDLPVLAIANDQDLPARLCVEAGIRDRLLRPIDRSEAVMRTGLALRAARFSSGFADSGGFAPVPTLHRLNRRSRRLPPERFAAVPTGRPDSENERLTLTASMTAPYGDCLHWGRLLWFCTDPRRNRVLTPYECSGPLHLLGFG